MKILIMKSLFISLGLLSAASSSAQSITSVYDVEVVSLMGDTINLHDFKGKKILFVNVASKCGFTPQYEGLQNLSNQYKDSLVVIGMPCNQFGSQEPGGKNEIASFCQKNYGVDFLILEKADVKGDNQHPLYKWLTNKDENGRKNSSVKWNFQKFLVDENGQLLDVFFSTTKPMSSKITKYFK